MQERSWGPTFDQMRSGADTYDLPRQRDAGWAPPPEGAPQPPRGSRWPRPSVGIYLLIADVVAFLAAAAITRPSSLSHGVVLLCVVVVHAAAGLYRSRLRLSVIDDLPYLLCAVGLAFAVKVPFALLLPVDGFARQAQHLSALFLALAVARFLAYTVVRQARRRGLARRATVILGSGALGERIAGSLLEQRHYGLDPVGFVDSDPPPKEPELFVVPVLGPYERLTGILRQHGARDVIVALDDSNRRDLVDILQACDRLDIRLFVVPHLYELHSVNRHTDEIWGIPVSRLRAPPMRSPWWPVKRIQDVAFAAIALLLLAPVMLACALAVRLESGRGVIFRQQRVGRDGRVFDLYKFRSLKPATEHEAETQWNIRHDDRLGRVGKFMRATSLDELPQLFNILKGDMSLVGPRPERPHFVEQFSRHVPRYPARHRVPAGLTGWAQVHGLRGDTSIEDRARFDNFYIANWSLWLDWKILIRTMYQVLGGHGG